MTTPTPITAHVPAALVRDFKHFDMGDDTDLYRRFKRLHDGPNIFVTYHADIEHILDHAEEFSIRHETVPIQPVKVNRVSYLPLTWPIAG